MNVDSILKEYRNFAWMLRLRCYFRPEDEEKCINPLRVANPYWRPQEAYYPLEDIIRFGKDTLREHIAKNPPLDKLTFLVKLARALQSIRKDDSIIIKSADKSSPILLLLFSLKKVLSINEDIKSEMRSDDEKIKNFIIFIILKVFYLFLFVVVYSLFLLL
eukprot:Gb_00273 [translate_table: standard]